MNIKDIHAAGNSVFAALSKPRLNSWLGICGASRKKIIG
jgi:hypothetical protein